MRHKKACGKNLKFYTSYLKLKLTLYYSTVCDMVLKKGDVNDFQMRSYRFIYEHIHRAYLVESVTSGRCSAISFLLEVSMIVLYYIGGSV
jgi:hypothetical protein